MAKHSFPKNFYWGASTAAHQVEGGVHNDWTVWELANAKRLAKESSRNAAKIPDWNEIKYEAQNPENYVSGRGVDHYHRYPEDLAIARSLNLNAFRFGIEWARIEPTEGSWNIEATEHYRAYIAEMRRQGLEPFMNIWHWTIPVWFEKLGGFKKRSNIKYFLRFVKLVSEEYGKDLTYVITINEPNVYVALGYLDGVRPPQEKSLWQMIWVSRTLTLAHREAYKTLKGEHPHLQIGMASQLGNIQAKRPHNSMDQMGTKYMRYVWNWWYISRVRKQQDFVGINYYFTDYFKHFHRANPKVPLNDMGWYMEPEGIYPILLRTWARYKKPIFVTENGLADMHDQYRRWWIEETIVAMERALSEGVDLRGYFHWSLLDNFEWESGWWPKFGLVAVDRDHDMKRTIKPSAKWFANFISNLR